MQLMLSHYLVYIFDKKESPTLGLLNWSIVSKCKWIFVIWRRGCTLKVNLDNEQGLLPADNLWLEWFDEGRAPHGLRLNNVII